MKMTTEVRGGNKFAQKLRQIQERVMAKRRVLVGLPAGSGEQDGTPLVVIGAANEFGAKITIPERQATITRQLKANGEFANGGRFKKNGNFQTEHIIPAHTVTIPERSFLRVPLHQNQDNIKKAFRALTGKVTRGEITAFQMLDQIGARAAGYCQEAIETGIKPENAPSTIARKGAATPLIDQGILKGAITHVVED